MPATGRQLLAQRQAPTKASALPDAPWPTGLVVGILTGGRPALLAETLASFFAHVSGHEITSVALVNGGDEATMEVLSGYPITSIIHHGGPMLPIGAACSLLARELPDGLTYLHLEDDWTVRGDLRRHIAAGAKLLDQGVGHVKLRSFSDNRNTRNVWGNQMTWEMKGKWYWTSANSHFTFNPSITDFATAKHVLQCTGERDAQDKYRALGKEIAQVFPGCFVHNDHGHSMRREKNLGHRDGETFT